MKFPKEKTYRSEKYLAWVRGHDCCSCGWPAELGEIQAHHVITGGMSIKGPDSLTVPLCSPDARGCHLSADKTPSSVKTYLPIAKKLFRQYSGQDI